LCEMRELPLPAVKGTHRPPTVGRSTKLLLNQNMKTTIFLVLSAALIASCQMTSGPAVESGMVKVTIMYPNGDGKTFDMDYYEKSHMPMLAELFGDAMKQYTIDKGIAGRTPEEPIPYLAIGYMYFNSLPEYVEAFGPNAEKILGGTFPITRTFSLLFKSARWSGSN